MYDAQAFAVVADLGKISDCKRTVDEAVEKMGGLDILVNRLVICISSYNTVTLDGAEGVRWS